MNVLKRYSAAYVARKRAFYTRWLVTSIIVFFIDVIVFCVLANRLLTADGETLFSSSTLEMVMNIVLAASFVMMPFFILLVGIGQYKRHGWIRYRRPVRRTT